MRTDGAIHVKHGDWLSKYSAAMYNDFTHVHEFGRMDKNGQLRPIHNVNLIFAGEAVYHIPTYRKTHPMRMGAIEITVSPLTAEQKKKVVLDRLKHDYDLQGERLEWLDHAAHISHGTDTAVEIAEVASLIAEGTAAATALQLVAAVLTPIMIGIAILNAADTDKRLAGMQAIGYTLTAWAFGDPSPPFPRSLKANWSLFPGKQALPRVEQAWKDTSDATVRNLEAQVAKKRVHKRSYQLFWQALGEGERKRLARMLMEVRAEELRGV